MQKIDNKSIGTCPCPVCGATAEVRKYRQKKKLDPKPSETPSRWSGRLYLYCPGKCKLVKFDNQDWILEHATITGEAPAEPTAEPLPPPAGDDPLPPPPETPAEPEPEPKKSKLQKFTDDWLL